MGALDDGERIRAADAAVWRAWLAENNERTGGVWPVRVFDDGTDDHASGQWFSPRRPGSGWAATNKARIAELEAAGLLAPAGIRVLEAAKANGSWTLLDGPEAGIEPDEFTAALDAVPVARANWDAFPKSIKKFGLTQIAMAKRPETKTARIAKIVADAAEGKRP